MSTMESTPANASENEKAFTPDRLVERRERLIILLGLTASFVAYLFARSVCCLQGFRDLFAVRAKNLNRLKNDFEGQRWLLSLLINQIILEGKEVRILGIIPVFEGPLDRSHDFFNSPSVPSYLHGT